MMTLLDPRFWLAALLACAATFAAGWFEGNAHGAKGVRDEWNATRLEADREAYVLEQRRLSRVAESVEQANAREARIRGDVALARRESDGLRGDLDAVRLHAAQSSDAASVAVATLGNLFESCVREYQGLAEVADGHASDSLMLQSAWPKE